MTPPDHRIDWFRILTQLKAEGWSLYAVSHFTGIPRTTLHGYKQGGQPSYHHGTILLRYWAQTCGTEVDAAPTISLYSYMK